jgi:hypothetical protein
MKPPCCWQRGHFYLVKTGHFYLDLTENSRKILGLSIALTGPGWCKRSQHHRPAAGGFFMRALSAFLLPYPSILETLAAAARLLYANCSLVAVTVRFCWLHQPRGFGMQAIASAERIPPSLSVRLSSGPSHWFAKI